MNGSALRILRFFLCFVLLNICSCTIQFFIYDVVSLFIEKYIVAEFEFVMGICVSGTSINWLTFILAEMGINGIDRVASYFVMISFDIYHMPNSALDKSICFAFICLEHLFLAVAFQSIVCFFSIL